VFDVLLDELRSHSTAWLEARRSEVIAAQRELHAEELAILRVLDERGRIDVTHGDAGESARTVREKTETARATEGPAPTSPPRRVGVTSATSSSRASAR
jgi:hypothetical protein